MKIEAKAHFLPLLKPFGISRGTKTSAEVIRVRLSSRDKTGFGEAVPYSRYQETIQSCLNQISSLPSEIDRMSLIELLPPGAARNAVDAALWDLEARITNQAVWQLAGFREPAALPMGYTITLDTRANMVRDALAHKSLELIKIKLGGNEDVAVITEIRKVLPAARLIIDANEGWSILEFQAMIPVLVAARVELIEQPVPSTQDKHLEQLFCPIPLCADESFEPGASLRGLSAAYGFVNIKLDKSGGLTHAIAELEEARGLGLGVMVGCMVGSSLSMAPAYLLAQKAQYSDLDGFLSIASDMPHPMQQEKGLLSAPKALWGYPG